MYEYDLDNKGVTDYGVAMDAILGGQEKVPPQAARFNVAFIGPVKVRKSALHLSDLVRKRVHLLSGGHLGTGSNLLDRAERSSRM